LQRKHQSRFWCWRLLWIWRVSQQGWGLQH
jgi:hypothetical protein